MINSCLEGVIRHSAKLTANSLPLKYDDNVDNDGVIRAQMLFCQRAYPVAVDAE